MKETMLLVIAVGIMAFLTGVFVATLVIDRFWGDAYRRGWDDCHSVLQARFNRQQAAVGSRDARGVLTAPPVAPPGNFSLN